MQIRYLVGGLEHQFDFPIYWVSNHPNWLIFFRGVAQPPTSVCHLDVFCRLRKDHFRGTKSVNQSRKIWTETEKPPWIHALFSELSDGNIDSMIDSMRFPEKIQMSTRSYMSHFRQNLHQTHQRYGAPLLGRCNDQSGLLGAAGNSLRRWCPSSGSSVARHGGLLTWGVPQKGCCLEGKIHGTSHCSMDHLGVAPILGKRSIAGKIDQPSS